MKRLISLLLIFVTFSICLFAEEDDYFDDESPRYLAVEVNE